jgi:acyl-CoA thioesterase-1
MPPMHKLAALIIVAMTSLASAQATRPAAFVEKLNRGTPQAIVFYGTSLTASGAWPKQVSDALTAKYPKLVTFHNGAMNGQQSRWGLANVKERVVKHNPDVVFVEFTTNDAVSRFKLPVDEAKKNTEGIIDAITAARPDCQVILLTMNPTHFKNPEPGRERIDLPAYEQMYRDLAKARGLLLVDNAPGWRALWDKSPDAFYKLVPDGVHPTGPGFAQYVTPNVLKTIGLE